MRRLDGVDGFGRIRLRRRAEAAGQLQGCPFELAVQNVDQFVDKKIADLTSLDAQQLQVMREASANAITPNVAISKQMSKEDLAKFERARHASISLGAMINKFAKFKRDVRVLAETYKVAEYADLYEVTPAMLGQFDPRRFNFMILEMLRVAQPKAMAKELINNGINCDPEAGLYFHLQLAQRQLAGRSIDSTNKAHLIEDIERLRTLYQVMWIDFDRGSVELTSTTWNGDTPVIPKFVEPAIAKLSVSSQTMWKTVLPFIDAQMPTDREFEVQYQTKLLQKIQAEYPNPR